jgi:glycosyltransferase involved in cell wall biosynthesis
LVDVKRFETVSDTAVREARKELGVADETLLFGIVGDVCRRKGQIYLIRALPQILSSVPNARLVIIGNTLDPQYKACLCAESEHLGVSDAVVWRPFEGNISGLMRTLDTCVNASLEESLGLTIPEAMAAGRAVVASNVGGIPENVVHGETGLLVRPAHPRDLASAISELLTDRERRERMGQAARQRVRALYNTERSVGRIEAIFADVIERGL